MPTLVLSPRVTPDSIRIWRAALSVGWDAVRFASWKDTRAVIDPVLYAEPLFVTAIGERLKIVPLEPELDWTIRLARKWRGREMQLTTLGKARLESGPLFVKPAEDKSFGARVYAKGSDLPEVCMAYPEDLPVIISEPVDFEVEYRCFMLDRRAITASIYMRNGDIADDGSGAWAVDAAELREATDFAEAIMADPTTPPLEAIVLDVGRLRGTKNLVAVEVNAAWGSGLCGCDEVKVLDVLRRSCSRPAVLRGQPKLVSLIDDKAWE